MTKKIERLNNLQVVLVEPQVPGNVGSTARAMKNMGLSRLTVVNPWFRDHPQSRYMAHGSEDILENARYTDTLEEAVADSVLVLGTTRRKRKSTPFMNARSAAEEIHNALESGQVSVLFGREDKGLSNDELKCCHIHVTIPSSEKQPSLNLSQAVLVMAYEIYMFARPSSIKKLDLAAAKELAGMYEHLEESLTTLGFRQWNDGDNYMKSLRRVFSRTKMEKRDVATIHKLCGEIDKYTSRLRAEMDKDSES